MVVITTLPVVRIEGILRLEHLTAVIMHKVHEITRSPGSPRIPHPIVQFAVPVSRFHVLGLSLHRSKVAITFRTIVMFRTVCIVLLEAFLASKVDVAALAHPVTVRVLNVLLVGPFIWEPPLTAIAVGHPST